MTLASTPSSPSADRLVRQPFVPLIVPLAVVGIADLVAAAAINGMAPSAVARLVAAGLLGKQAMAGGAASATLGIVLQTAMTIVIAALFWLCAPRAAALTGNRLVIGLSLGAVVFGVMNFVVVPLSAIGRVPVFPTIPFFLAHLATMLAYGLALACLTLRRAP